MQLDQFKPRWRFVEVGLCGLNCHKPKPNSTRNIISSAADFDIYINIYIRFEIKLQPCVCREFLKPSSSHIRRSIVFSCFVGERVLGCNWDLRFLRVFQCTIVSSYFIVKSLQLHEYRQIAELRKYCLVRVIVFFGMCYLYLFCFSQVGILVKFPTPIYYGIF